MDETELEKIVQPVFESVHSNFGQRIWKSFKWYTCEGKQSNIPLPWFCANDTEFLTLLNEPHYFYRCTYKGINAEYVVVPYFYSLIDHTKACKNPKVCNHTFEYMVEFLLSSKEEQEEILKQLSEEQRFEDRLQFLLTGGSQEHVFSVSCIPEVQLNKSDYFEHKYTSQYYRTARRDGMKHLNAHKREVFSKIEKLFEGGLSRTEIKNYQWTFGPLLRDALVQGYGGKKGK